MSNASLARRNRRAGIWAAAGTVAVLAASLTACGSSNDSSATAEGDSGSSSSASTGSSDLDAFTKPLDAYPVPTTPVGDVSSLKGKTVYYIPVTLQSPQFAVTQKALTAAADKVGIKVQVCDGKGTPTNIAACVTQATDAKAGVIVSDAIPYALASNAFGAAQAANIPVIISNQLADDSTPNSKTLAYLPAGGSQMEAALATFITKDSGGKANVLINMSTDGPSPAGFVAAGQKVYDEKCPDCKITINKVSSANFSLIPSSTSAALLKDPNITYVESQFEQYLQATQSGIQQTSRTGIKTVTGGAQLSGVKAVANGSLAAAAAQASAFQGWVDIDAAMRLMLGEELPDYTIPVRLFTKDTMSDVKLTSAAEQSGEWFGPATFTDDFAKLWGLA